MTELQKFKRVAFVGPLGVGKDHVAAQLGGTVIGFADPLYQLARVFFPHVNCADKTAPGVRALLQQLGQYGRGTVSERYPLTAERGLVEASIRMTAGQADTLSRFGVNWNDFGRNPDIWVEALIFRASQIDGKVLVTNCRFENELEALRKAGFVTVGVACKRSTLAQRQNGRATANDTHDVSENLGKRAFEAFFHQTLAQEVDGYVWNDEGPAPFHGKAVFK